MPEHEFANEAIAEFTEHPEKYANMPEWVIATVLHLAMMQDTFQCRRCGKCCRRQHPLAFRMEDLKDLAPTLGLNVPQFLRKYRLKRSTAMDGSQKFMLDWPEGGHCPFFDDEKNLCTVHAHRPLVCHQFPYYTGTSVERSIQLGRSSLWFNGDCPYVREHADNYYRQMGWSPNYRTEKGEDDEKTD